MREFDAKNSIAQRLKQATSELMSAIGSGNAIDLSEMLQRYELANNQQAAVALIVTEYNLKRNLGQPIPVDNYVKQFPQYAPQLQNQLNVSPEKADCEYESNPRSTFNSTILYSGDKLETQHWNSEADTSANSDVPQNFGRYQIRKEIGQGGFGRVWLAFDPELHRDVAIKQPKDLLKLDDAQIELFITEARRVAQLDHPNIAQVLDAGRTDNGVPYIVSKFIDGVSLRTLLENETVSLDETVSIISAIGDALHYAHTQGVIHRDVKPANILIDSQGNAFLSDFGLSLLVSEQARSRGEVCGTPAYMPPEQIKGESHQLDGRADIWSLGVVLYEMLVGQRPFIGTTRDYLFEEITSREPRPLRQIKDSLPEAIERICLKAIEKQPAHRFTTAKDMADELRNVSSESKQIDTQFQELSDKNERLRAEIELQKELSEIDREWQAERDRHKIKYLKYGGAVEPTPSRTATGVILTCIFMVWVCVSFGGSYALLAVILGLGNSIYLMWKHSSYARVEGNYQHRREHATRKFDSRIEQLSNPERSAESSVMTDQLTETEFPESRGRVWFDFALVVIVVGACSAPFLILPNMERTVKTPRLKRSEISQARQHLKPASMKPPATPQGDNQSADSLVEYLASGTPAERSESVRLLKRQSDPPKQLVPKLCKLLEQKSGQPESVMIRLGVLEVIEAMGPNGKEAVPTLASHFCTLPQDDDDTYETEALATIAAIQKIGSEDLLSAEVPKLLASADSDFWVIEISRVIAEVAPNYKISGKESIRIIRAFSSRIGVSHNGGVFPEDVDMQIFDWINRNLPGRLESSDPIHLAISELLATVDKKITNWEQELDELEASLPPRTTRRRVAGRIRIRTNPEYISHKRKMTDAADRIERYLAISESLHDSMLE